MSNNFRLRHRQPTPELRREINAHVVGPVSKPRQANRHIIYDHDEDIGPSRACGGARIVRNWTLHATKGWRSNLQVAIAR